MRHSLSKTILILLILGLSVWMILVVRSTIQASSVASRSLLEGLRTPAYTKPCHLVSWAVEEAYRIPEVGR